MTFKINLSGLCERECFAEASREELRVLLALLSLDGVCPSEAELAKMAGVSPARCRSSLVLFTESGVITEAEGDGVIDEFRESRDEAKRYDKPSTEVARSIRDGEMASFLADCAALMGKPAFSTEEIKDIEYILTDLGLSKEYVLLLAAHLAERRKTLTPRILLAEVNKLLKKGIDTTEELEIYIIRVEKTTTEEWEFKNKFELYRALSPTEKKYIAKWYGEYGFTTEIVYAAYGAATKTVSSNIPYSKMDRILTVWHEAGCTTVTECLDKGEALRKEREAQEKARRAEEKKSTASGGGKKKAEPETSAKYNDFDTEDALLAALKRSYGGDGENE